MGSEAAMSRKQVLIAVCALILALIALFGVVVIWVTLFNKSWHPVGDFTLSPSKTSEQFNIQGEEWRLTYTFNAPNPIGVQAGYIFGIKDADGNIVGGLNGMELSGLRDSGKGILSIREGQGDYSVEMRGITGDYTLSFKVEEYY
jgi:hypothetical protein